MADDPKEHPVTKAIDAAWERDAEDGFREHLGASLIGRACEREIWYSHRWASLKKHAGRILRLFNRGHLEEFRFVENLQKIGATVWENDPETELELLYHGESDSYTTVKKTGKDIEAAMQQGCEIVTGYPTHEQYAKDMGVVVPKPKQFRISNCHGHFGGSTDGQSINVPGVEKYGLPPSTLVLNEYKTHGEKSFLKLMKIGVAEAKPEHVAQMQVYMGHRGLPIGLYQGINKNTDELYSKFIPYKQEICLKYTERANQIIFSPKPPRRINKSSSYFECRFCDHKATCHLGKPMHKTCRSCTYAQPITGGKWFCNRWQKNIPNKTAAMAGCPHYNMIRD